MLVPSSRGHEGEDLILLEEERGPEARRWLVARDGPTGDEVWRRPFASDPALADAPRALLEAVLLVPEAEKLLGVSPDSGETLWARELGALPSAVCRGQGYAGLRLSDGAFQAFAVATGSRVDGEGKTCEDVVTSRSVAPNFSLVEGAALERLAPGRPPLQVVRGLVPHAGTARVLLGTDSPEPVRAGGAARGARVAVASGKRWLWDARLGRGNADQARLLSPPLAAVRRERVLVPYVSMSAPELRLASLELGSGRLVWDVSISSDGVSSDGAEQTTDRAELRISHSGEVYFFNGVGQLWVIGVDGRPAWSLGAL